MKIKQFIEAKWKNIAIIALLLCVFILPSISVTADVIHIREAGGGAGLWEVDGSETQLIGADEIDMQTKKIINVVDPAANQDAATKKYVDDNIYPGAGEQAFLDADHSKLDGIEALADVTDAANVGAAGALMVADLENPPTEDEASKAPTSEWAFDHDADADAHYTHGTMAAETATDYLAIADLENPPTEDLATTAPTSEWAFDHDAAITGVHGVTGDIVGTTATQTLSNKDLAGDLDFNKYKAIALACDNGATMPASASAGQWFLHTPTGRNILYQYDGSNWGSIISIGSMTVYVDKTDGTDQLTDHGTGVDGDAFATVQFAVDCIPGLVGGSVTININNESYDETVTIRGKAFTGAYTITLQGTLNQQDTATIESAVQGTGATQGSITDTGKFGSYDNMLMYANSEYRIIDSDTADVATIVGTWSGVPSGTWIVYDWGTDINKITVLAGQQGVLIYDIELDTPIGLAVGQSAQVSAYRIKTTAASSHALYIYDGGRCTVSISYIEGVTNAVEILTLGYLYMERCKVYTTSINDTAIRLHDMALLRLAYGCIVDASSTTGTEGIWAKAGCTVNLGSGGAAQGYNRVEGQGIGLYTTAGGVIFNTSDVQFSGNTIDESPSGASDPAYID